LVDGFRPAASDVFVVLARGGGSGQFAGLPEGGLYRLADGSTFNLTYAADWAGAQSGSGLTGGNDVALYNFQPVPEPGTVGLSAVAAAGLLARRRRPRP
jgi:hypothetical protein